MRLLYFRVFFCYSTNCIKRAIEFVTLFPTYPQTRYSSENISINWERKKRNERRKKNTEKKTTTGKFSTGTSTHAFIQSSILYLNEICKNSLFAHCFYYFCPMFAHLLRNVRSISAHLLSLGVLLFLFLLQIIYFFGLFLGGIEMRCI